MAPQDEISTKAKRPRKLLAGPLAGLSLTLGVLGLLGGALGVGVLYQCGEWSRLIGHRIFETSLPFALGAILLGHWRRFRPGYLCGYAWLVPLLLTPIAQELSRKRPCGPPSAVRSLHTIITAEITYSSTYNNGYSPTLSSLGPSPVGNRPTPMNAGLTDDVLAGTGSTSEKSGYRFDYKRGSPDEKGRINSFSITASPLQPVKGKDYFYADETGVIRRNTRGPAGPDDAPLQE